MFDALRRHKKLPSTYLFEYSGKKSFDRFVDRLTELYNGTTDGTYYLDRPEEQYNNMNARYQAGIYSLKGDKGGGWFVHQLMSACLRASFELMAKRLGHGFIWKDEILNGKPLRLKLKSGKRVVNDGLFGISYGNEARMFACEDDRATESIEGKQVEATYIGKKLTDILTVFSERAFHQWDIDGLMILLATTTDERKHALLNWLDGQRFADRILIKVPKVEVAVHPALAEYPGQTEMLCPYGKRWFVPPVHTDIFEGWESVRGPFDIRT